MPDLEQPREQTEPAVHRMPLIGKACGFATDVILKDVTLDALNPLAGDIITALKPEAFHDCSLFKQAVCSNNFAPAISLRH